MERDVNILILSAGTRNKIVRYFKNAFRGAGAVFAADASPLAPAIYEADGRFIVPTISTPGYIDGILEICSRERINGVLSLIDPELGLLARNEDRFKEIGVTVIGSSSELCDIALDKMRTYRWLRERGYSCAEAWTDREAFYRAVADGEAVYPVFVKPITGSASIGISAAQDRETIEYLFSHAEGLMIQEFLRGQEIGADVYADMITGEVVSIFTKKKLKMRAGETDKAVSFKDPALFALLERFIGESGFRGAIDVDLFEIDGEYRISEVNPRFGGGYPHAYECGCDHMRLILNNLRGQSNPKRIGAYEDGVYMMKYSDVLIRKAES